MFVGATVVIMGGWFSDGTWHGSGKTSEVGFTLKKKHTYPKWYVTSWHLESKLKMVGGSVLPYRPKLRT